MPSFSDSHFARQPKAELHLHLEGSIQPSTVCKLAAQNGFNVTLQDVAERYAYRDFLHFIEAFKWVTTFLRHPGDYGLVAADLGEYLLSQAVVYAEVTLSIGVMLLREQDPVANFEALLEATAPFTNRGLHFRWVFDAVRQFGAAAAMDVVSAARRCDSKHIVAFEIGGDELSLPTRDFCDVYAAAGDIGLHRLMHAGETGGPEKIREAIELLGAERIGHGIATVSDPALMDMLAERKIPLEICPMSNIKTGALAKLLNRSNVSVTDNPLPRLLRHGIPVVLSTDDPAMFQTTLLEEYDHAAAMGLSEPELQTLLGMSLTHSFSPDLANSLAQS